MQTRRRTQKLPLEDKDKLLDAINKEYQEHLVDFAKYFANSRNAEVAVVAEIDSEGLDLTYFEPYELGLRELQVRVQWNRPISSSHDVYSEMKILHSEVKMAQKMYATVDKTYVSPGKKEPVLFVNPSLEEYVFIILYWGVVLFFSVPAVIPEPLYDFIVMALGTYDTIYNIVFAVVCVNTGLSLAVLYNCLTAEMPLNICLKWAGLTLFFGFMTAANAIKIAFKRKSRIAAEDDIG